VSGFSRYPREGEGSEGDAEDWMLTFASMTVFPNSSLADFTAEFISRSGMDLWVLPANDEKRESDRI
jgi:hypothetical protein